MNSSFVTTFFFFFFGNNLRILRLKLPYLVVVKYASDIKNRKIFKYLKVFLVDCNIKEIFYVNFLIRSILLASSKDDK